MLLALVLLTLVRGLLLETSYVSSASMQPLLQPGDRVVVDKLDRGSPHRGEVVLFDGTTVFGGPDPPQPAPGAIARLVRGVGSAVGVSPEETDYVKRVVGLPGDRVRCCTGSGRISIDGAPIDEPYVYAGEAPSSQRFDVLVPAGTVFVLGDHRSVSADSRAHLSDPGGGMVPISDIIGSIAWRYWPPGRSGTLSSTTAFAHVPSR